MDEKGENMAASKSFTILETVVAAAIVSIAAISYLKLSASSAAIASKRIELDRTAVYSDFFIEFGRSFKSGDRISPSDYIHDLGSDDFKSFLKRRFAVKRKSFKMEIVGDGSGRNSVPAKLFAFSSSGSPNVIIFRIGF